MREIYDFIIIGACWHAQPGSSTIRASDARLGPRLISMILPADRALTRAGLK
jgi:hypothetical protein